MSAGKKSKLKIVKQAAVDEGVDCAQVEKVWTPHPVACPASAKAELQALCALRPKKNGHHIDDGSLVSYEAP